MRGELDFGIKTVAMDMWGPYISTAIEHLPSAVRTELARPGLDRDHSFSWERSVHAHYGVLPRAMDPAAIQ